ncbi:MAG: hypothetical protein AseanaTS_21460 [Candidatus Pelagadaptatus aseana]|uniref:HlyD family efflux transporter periplasmic adaptor subunit n=1 Tax=Candidatus Pelagadaptatus aseana TaxID=3120508 RepID=UPI0039B31329
MASLPRLREDLILHTAPSSHSGAPNWSLQDPVRNLFFRIDWQSFEMLSRWHLGDSQKVLEAIDVETTITTDKDDMENLIGFLSDNELIQRHDPQSSRWFAEREQQSPSLGKKLVQHYLFFRVPLWHPDRWLDRHLAKVTPLFGKSFLLLTLVVLAVGLMQLSQQWQTFSSSLVNLFTWQGVIAFGLTIALVKFLHELGHAFTAKRYGCRVPTMGVAFLLLLPMAYTDVNDVWRLRSKRQRLAVGSAGIMVELAIAAWATLVWSLLPEGQLRNAAFLLASTTWISSLLINLSPFLRFDGYFLVMDWLDMPNLHQRSFALGKWWLRNGLFGLAQPAPEPLPPERQRLIIAFCFATWLYRLIIFIGIAWLLYQMLPKPLGPLLAAMELWWFIAAPILKELSHWTSQWRAILASGRSWLTGFGFLIALLLLAIPWDGRIEAQGILQPERSADITSPGAARIDNIMVSDGSYLNAGDTLMMLTNPDLMFQKQNLNAKLKSLDWQLQTALVEASFRENRQRLQAEMLKTRSEQQLIDDEIKRYSLVAPLNGHFYFAAPDIRSGDWIGDKQILGQLVDKSQWQVTTYVTEAQLSRLKEGDRARFYTDSGSHTPFELLVSTIEPDATRILEDDILASTHGGKILVRESDSGLTPEQAHYRVTLTLDESQLEAAATLKSLRGNVVIQGQPKAYLDDFFRAVAVFFVREASF